MATFSGIPRHSTNTWCAATGTNGRLAVERAHGARLCSFRVFCRAGVAVRGAPPRVSTDRFITEMCEELKGAK